MSVLLRVSRIRDPRSTLASSILLFVAFSLFGIRVDSSTKFANSPPASVFSEHVDLRCASLPEEGAAASSVRRAQWTAPVVDILCPTTMVLETVC